VDRASGPAVDSEAELPVMPGRVGRVGLLPMALLVVLPFATEAALRLLVQLYLRDLNASTTIISLSTSLCWLGILFGSAFWGVLSDSKGRRLLLSLILVGSAAAVAAGAFLPTVEVTLLLVFVRVALLIGIGPITMAIVSAASSARNRGRSLSYLSALRTGGFMLGSALAGFVLASAGYRWSFVLFAVLPLVSLSALFRSGRGDTANGASRHRTFHLLRRGGLRSLYLGTVFRQMGNTGAGSLIFVYMATLGISPSSSGLLSALNPAMQIAAMLVFGHVADRIGRQRVFLIGFSLSVVVLALFGVSRSAAGIAAGFGLLGVAFPALFIGSASYIGDLVPRARQGAMLGLFESSRGLGGVLGPLIAGSLTPWIGYRGMFLVMAGLAGIGLVFVLLGRHHRVGAPTAA